MIQSPPVMNIIKISKSKECLRRIIPPDADAAAAAEDAELLLLIMHGGIDQGHKKRNIDVLLFVMN